MPLVPAWFAQALTALDSHLSVRWGSDAGAWVIQRKAFIPESELGYLIRQEGRLRTLAFTPAKDSGDRKIYHDRQSWLSCVEELKSARVSCRVIFTTKVLNDQIFKALCQTDIKRYGGYARFADALEAEEDREERERERIAGNKRDALNGEVHSILRFLVNKRGSLLDQNEQDLRFMLHGKRTKQGDGELLPLKEF